MSSLYTSTLLVIYYTSIAWMNVLEAGELTLFNHALYVKASWENIAPSIESLATTRWRHMSGRRNLVPLNCNVFIWANWFHCLLYLYQSTKPGGSTASGQYYSLVKFCTAEARRPIQQLGQSTHFLLCPSCCSLNHLMFQRTFTFGVG